MKWLTSHKFLTSVEIVPAFLTMKSSPLFQTLAVAAGLLQHLIPGAFATDKLIDLPISARTPENDGDNTAVYQSSSNPLLLGNDGSATGGFHIFSLDGSSPLEEVSAQTTGRSKLVPTVYNVGGKDLIVTISQPDNVLRVFDIEGVKEIEMAAKSAIGDWSALCTWKSLESGEQYLYLFGKKQVVQHLIRESIGFEIIEVNVPCCFSGNNANEG